MAIGFLGLAGRGISALGRRRAANRARRQAQAQTGQQAAENITGRKQDKSQNPRISFGHDSPVMSSAMNISESTGTATTTATTPEGVAVQIESKTIRLKDALRRSLILDKEHEKNKKILSKKGKRSGAEDILEKNKFKGRFSLPIPGAGKVKSLWENIKDFFITIFWGWLAIKLVPHIGKLKKVITTIASAVNWMIDIGITFLDIASTALSWGYAAYDWTRMQIKNVFGENALEAFDGFMGTLNKVINGVVVIGMGMAAMMAQLALKNWGILGAKAAAVAGSAATTGVTAGGVVVTTSGGAAVGAAGGTAGTAAATVGGVSAGVAAGTIAAAGALAVGLGEGIYALGKKGYAVEDDWRQKADEKWWTDPRKYWWGIGAGMLAITNRVWSFFGGILDIVGAPFRMLAELIMFPFLSEEGKKKQRDNLVKYDTRIREQFRKFMNMFDIFGMVSDDEGSWGSIYGDKASKKASKEMFGDKKKEEVKRSTPRTPVTENTEKRRVSARFDTKTGKGYINGKEVPMDEYVKFSNMSDKEKINQYGGQQIPILNKKEAEQTSDKGSEGPTSTDQRKEGSKLAGELGRFLDAKGLGRWGSGVHRHPEHPPWDPESGHRVGSLHYQSQGARAIDIGGWGPDTFKSKGLKGIDDQTKIIEGIRAFEQFKGGLKRAEFAHEGTDPKGHWNHVHVAYHKGGEVPGTGERMAKLLGGEIVIDVDSAGPAKDMLLAINQASTYEGVVDAIRKFAPYDAMAPEVITVPRPPEESPVMEQPQQSIEDIMSLMITSGPKADPYQILYKS